MNVRQVRILGLNQQDPGPLLFSVLENLEVSQRTKLLEKEETSRQLAMVAIATRISSRQPQVHTKTRDENICTKLLCN